MLGGSGRLVTPPGEFTINAAAEDPRLPAVTTHHVATTQESRYRAVRRRAEPGLARQLGYRQGQPHQRWAKVAGQIAPFPRATDDETAPVVVARPGAGCVTVWQRCGSTGEENWAYHQEDVNADALEIAAASWDHEDPAVAWGQVASLIVYEGDSQGDPTVYRHIYGRRRVPNAVFLPLVVRDK
ncbi:MAG: hypothetical protein MUQ10_01600 [Anaerolineae bacterium]|nr:hypothetical protein [Anaerolineae bacterium]